MSLIVWMVAQIRTVYENCRSSLFYGLRKSVHDEPSFSLAVDLCQHGTIFTQRSPSVRSVFPG